MQVQLFECPEGYGWLSAASCGRRYERGRTAPTVLQVPPDLGRCRGCQVGHAHKRGDEAPVTLTWKAVEAKPSSYVPSDGCEGCGIVFDRTWPNQRYCGDCRRARQEAYMFWLGEAG